MKKFNNNGQLAYGPLALQLPGPAHGKRHKAPKMLPDQPVPARNKRTPLLATVWEPTFHEMSLHEWWGLNDQIKSVASALADTGYLALAIDLYDGQVTDDPQTARGLVGAVDGAAATDTCASWVSWLRDHENGSGKVGTVGWCFGGGWSLNASLAAPVDATVIYYGNVKKGRERLAALAGPVLGHFATRDNWINQEMVEGFEAELAAAGKSAENHWYEADHGFANPTSARYDEEDAALSWQRTLAFFDAHLA